MRSDLNSVLKSQDFYFIIFFFKVLEEEQVWSVKEDKQKCPRQGSDCGAVLQDWSRESRAGHW